MPAPWMIDELAYAGAEHLDPGFVTGYDRKQGRPDPAADLDLLEQRGIGASAAVLDFGAGTGQFAVPAAARFARVVAVDVSPVMLERLCARAAEAGATNVEAVRSGFLGYEHSGAPADAVHTRNALHQLPDFWKTLALERIARVLRPGGILRLHDLIYDFAPAEAEQRFAEWFAGAADDPSAGYTADDYAEHIRTEFSTFRWLLEPMLDVAGFDIVDAEFSGPFFGAYTCVRR